jgi:PIN domain nuclease of toxin-antitoxin system
MGYLIDTHILLYALANPQKLTSKQKAILEDSNNIIYISIASIWEIYIKKSLGKLKFNFDIEAKLSELNIQLLNISVSDCQLMANLPLHHKDPFDRMIIASSINEGLRIISNDGEFKHYDIELVT